MERALIANFSTLHSWHNCIDFYISFIALVRCFISQHFWTEMHRTHSIYSRNRYNIVKKRSMWALRFDFMHTHTRARARIRIHIHIDTHVLSISYALVIFFRFSLWLYAWVYVFLCVCVCVRVCSSWHVLVLLILLCCWIAEGWKLLHALPCKPFRWAFKKVSNIWT